MYCANCGQQLGSHVKFCANCGSPVAGEASVQGDDQYIKESTVSYHYDNRVNVYRGAKLRWHSDNSISLMSEAENGADLLVFKRNISEIERFTSDTYSTTLRFYKYPKVMIGFTPGALLKESASNIGVGAAGISGSIFARGVALALSLITAGYITRQTRESDATWWAVNLKAHGVKSKHFNRAVEFMLGIAIWVGVIALVVIVLFVYKLLTGQVY